MSSPVQSTMMDQPLVISTILRHAEANHSTRQIHSRSAEGELSTTTYGEIGVRASRLAAGLRGLGVGPGDRVGTLALNSARHMEIYFAVACMGAIYHTLNPRLDDGQATYIVDHAGDQVIFFDPHLAPLVERWRPLMPGVRHWIAMGAEDVAAGGPTLCYEQLVTSEDLGYAWLDVDERAPAALCYTSGTTGDPKGVLYSHRALVVQALAACLPDAENISARDTILVCVPMFHVNGWGLPYSGAITGAGLVLPGPHLDGATLIDLMDRFGVTLGAGVPTIWQDLVLQLEQQNHRLATLERVISGGSALPLPLARSLTDHGLQVLCGWGMTETTAACTFNAPVAASADWSDERRQQISVSQGRPMFPIELRLVDDAGNPVPQDGSSTGELQARGLWVTGEYFRGDEVAQDGWFSTGDIASIDPDGYMRMSDRSKDLIKSGGEWISSAAVEELVLEHPALHQAAVVAGQDPVWGERPVLFAVLKPGCEPPTLEDVQQLVVTQRPRWWAPDRIEWVDQLPIGPTGKVLKRELRDRLAIDQPVT